MAFFCTGSWWLIEIRHGVRLAEWNRAGNRRRDISDIESGCLVDVICSKKPCVLSHILWQEIALFIKRDPKQA